MGGARFVFFDVAYKVDASAGELEEEVVGVLETGEVLVNGLLTLS